MVSLNAERILIKCINRKKLICIVNTKKQKDYYESLEYSIILSYIILILYTITRDYYKILRVSFEKLTIIFSVF